jgi:hypothetical protein
MHITDFNDLCLFAVDQALENAHTNNSMSHNALIVFFSTTSLTESLTLLIADDSEVV